MAAIVSAVTSNASTPLIFDSISIASPQVIAIHEVAYASASMAFGAITVADSRSVCAGRPVVGLIVCQTFPSALGR